MMLEKANDFCRNRLHIKKAPLEPHSQGGFFSAYNNRLKEHETGLLHNKRTAQSAP